MTTNKVVVDTTKPLNDIIKEIIIIHNKCNVSEIHTALVCNGLDPSSDELVNILFSDEMVMLRRGAKRKSNTVKSNGFKSTKKPTDTFSKIIRENPTIARSTADEKLMQEQLDGKRKRLKLDEAIRKVLRNRPNLNYIQVHDKLKNNKELGFPTLSFVRNRFNSIRRA